MTRLVIDRLEGELVVCETEERQTMTFPRNAFPPDAAEGDWFQMLEPGVFLPDPEETARRRAQILALQRKLFRRRPKEE